MKLVLKDGSEIQLLSLDKAPIRVVVELQRQTGWSLSDIQRRAKEADVLGSAITAFLSMHAVGKRVKWDYILDHGLSDVGRPLFEAGDTVPATVEGGGEADARPTQTHVPSGPPDPLETLAS